MPKHTTGKPQDFKPIPPGEYDGHVGEIRVSQRDDGNEKWDVPFIIDGEEYAGRMLWETLIFGLPQTAWKIDQFVAATMGPHEEGEEVDLESENFQELPARVRVFTDTYQGEAKSKIKTWIAKEDGEGIEKTEPAKSAAPPTKPEPTTPAKPAAAPTPSGKKDRF